MFEKQAWHLVALAALLYAVSALTDEATLAGEYLGLSTCSWLVIAIAAPIAHQLYVWFCWRAELHHKLITRSLGANGFVIYQTGFLILLLSRLLTILALALSNRGSAGLDPGFAWSVALVFMLASFYLMHSVIKHFGIRRACGVDHFDASYRDRPFVREGIFRITGNAMYSFGLLILWVPGLVWFSKAAILAALFNHVYIWVHYYFTELPDIKRIYHNDPHH